MIETEDYELVLFQFPSNGKAYTKRRSSTLTPRLPQKVSIPFKREGIYKVFTGATLPMKQKFQFPSNGKAYTKRQLASDAGVGVQKCFNSLQTGRHIQRGMSPLIKASTIPVSIPFKREGIYKDMRVKKNDRTRSLRFNSLQTGRHIQR